MAHTFINITEDSEHFFTSSFSNPGGSNSVLNYRSAKQLYYSNFPVNDSEGVIISTGSFDNFLESTINTNRSIFPYTGSIFSIPRKLYGTHLEPNTIKVVSGSYTLTDDGEGNLMNGSTHVGNVIYSHGQIILTDNAVAYEFNNELESISFKSNVTIYTQTYNIKISDFEYNHTFNPTAQTGSTVLEYSGSKYLQPSGQYSNNITGSAFQPYITTVGLYNSANQLLAVGKLAQPLPKPIDTELTIQIKLDV